MKGVSAIVVMVILAGCSAGDEAPSDVEIAAASTGAIRGVVVDQSITPLAGVTVHLRGEQVSNTTNADGSFRFADLEPGTYVVSVNQSGFVPQETLASVVAGVHEPEAISLVLTADVESRPYFEVLQFSGFIECGTSTTALCAVPNYASQEICREVGTCLGDINGDRFTRRDVIARLPQWLQTELIWETTQPISDRLQMTVSHWTVAEPLAFETPYEILTGPSPLLVMVNETALRDSGLGGTDGLQVSVWSGDIEGTTMPICIFTCAGPGFAIQQPFDAFTHMFYNTKPAEGWRFSDEPVPR